MSSESQSPTAVINTVALQAPQLEASNDTFRHVHTDGSVETVVGREQALRLCPELGRIASKDPEMANSLLDISNIEIPDLDIDSLLAEKFERDDKAKSDTKETNPPKVAEKIQIKNSIETNSKVVQPTLESIRTTDISSKISELLIAEQARKQLLAEQTQKSKTLEEKPKTEKTKKDEAANRKVKTPTPPKLVKAIEKPKPEEKSKIRNTPAKKLPLPTVKTKNNTEKLKPANKAKTVVESKNVHHRESTAPAIKPNEKKFETNRHNKDASHPVIEILDRKPDTEKLASDEAEIDEPFKIEGLEYFDAFEDTWTETSTEVTTDAIIDDYIQETLDLPTESTNFETETSERVEVETDQKPIDNSFEAFVESQPEIEPISLEEILQVASEQPIEQTFLQIINTAEKETPEYQEVVVLVQGISEMIIELANNPETDMVISPEIVKNILNLLTMLGYEHPQEALVDLVSRHDLEFLAQSIQYLSQLLSEDNQQEFLLQKTPASFISNISNTISVKLGRLSLSYYFN